jgi:hypothetical protein
LVSSFLYIFFLLKLFYCISLSLFHLFPFLFNSFFVFTFFLFMFVSCFNFFYSYFVYLNFFSYFYAFIYLFIFYFLFQKNSSFSNMFYNINNYLSSFSCLEFQPILDLESCPWHRLPVTAIDFT